MLKLVALLKLIKPVDMVKIYNYVFKPNELDNAIKSVVDKITLIEHDITKLKEDVKKLEIKLK